MTERHRKDSFSDWRGAPRRVLVVGDSVEIRAILDHAGAALLVSEARSREAMNTALAAERPHLCVVIGVPRDSEEADLVRTIHAVSPHLPVLVVADAPSEARIVGSLKAGASGYLFLEDLQSRLASAVREALAGGTPMSGGAAQVVLTRARRHSTQLQAVDAARPSAPAPALDLGKRKREIVEMLSRGLSYEQIGSGLGISVNTVRTHVREIYDRLGASTKVEAVLIAMELGILPKR